VLWDRPFEPDPGNSGGGKSAKRQGATQPPGGSVFSDRAFSFELEGKMTNKVSIRTIIIANGHLSDPNKTRRHIRPDDRIICADGGTHHARSMELTPDIVVGDLDSLDPALCAELEAAGVRFEIHPARKDETDLELALRLAVAEGANEIEILAMLGGRLDQSLANLLLLARPEWASAQVRATEGSQSVWPVRGGQETIIGGECGDLLSLVPVTPLVSGVTLKGVEWPLHAATLRFGSTLTISNRLTRPPARLLIGEGAVLVIHQSTAKEEATK
jgi:thiamine pyrophosphokinase